MPKTDPQEFDFEYWSNLAQEDPASFEAERTELLDEYILTTPVDIQKRLRGLQWQVEQVRNLSGTPMAAYLRLSKMMWESLEGERGLLESIESLKRPASQQVTPANKASASVLPFKSRKSED